MTGRCDAFSNACYSSREAKTVLSEVKGVSKGRNGMHETGLQTTIATHFPSSVLLRQERTGYREKNATTGVRRPMPACAPFLKSNTEAA